MRRVGGEIFVNNYLLILILTDGILFPLALKKYVGASRSSGWRWVEVVLVSLSFK